MAAVATMARKMSKYLPSRKKRQQAPDGALLPPDIFKILVVGPGGTGTSTVARQARLQYGGEFTDDERRQMTPVVHANVVSAMKLLIKQCHNFGYGDDIQDKASCELLMNCEDTAPVDAELGTAVKSLWADSAIERTWHRRNEFQAAASTAYFLDGIERIAAPGYVADTNDMLHVHSPSSGVVVDQLKVGRAVFEVVDMGSRHNLSEVWTDHMENVGMVIYVVALSDYDQVMTDGTTNRMEDALSLFSDLCQDLRLKGAAFAIYLNKLDLCEAKIKEHHLAEVSHFADFTGPPGNHDAVMYYFLQKFTSMRGGEAGCHITCATDPTAKQAVHSLVGEVLLRQHLQKGNFI